MPASFSCVHSASSAFARSNQSVRDPFGGRRVGYSHTEIRGSIDDVADKLARPMPEQAGCTVEFSGCQFEVGSMDPLITPTPNGPLHAEGIPALTNDRGETIDTSGSIYLCRCGGSKNKPYCDGSHETGKFSDRRIRQGGTPREFVGREITVVDDFSLCAHAGECVEGAPATFFTKGPDGRASLPDATIAAQVIATIRRCPSGSLLYKLHGKLEDKYAAETVVRVEKDGPLHVKRAKLAGDARPATEDHYTLCRCGASLNKPFCDGMHAKIKFSDAH